MKSPIIARALAIVSTGLLLAAYTRGHFVLGFFALVPWLISLERSTSWRAALLDGVLMSMVLSFAIFAWLGAAVAAYTGLGQVSAILLICLLAPIWQPQVWLYALVRALTQKRAAWLSIWCASAVWILSEWLWPKALGDTLGYGLAPSLYLRQAADLAGAAGLTAALLIVNAALALLWQRRKLGWRALLGPSLIALLLPAAMAGYGVLRLHTLRSYFAADAPAIRIGMVQTSIVDYEARRQQSGSYAVVRDVLDRHFALSQAAIEHHGAEALLWSETVYPTPYGYPRSEAGAAFDHELRSFADAMGVPLLFGSYDVDQHGEYNAAVLLDRQRELTARYRKTRLFPFTEQIPHLLDYPWLRSLLPWSGNWLSGDGARVFPLSTKDGRELNVVPLICLDDVDPMLAIEGARLGAQAIVGLSNDSWFSRYQQGVQLHLAVASFRSIETRMPQLRVTTNGYTAFIDPTGEVLARTVIGDQAVLAGVVPIRNPPTSLVTRWGYWLGPAALASLTLMALLMARSRFRARPHTPSVAVENPGDRVSVLTKPLNWLVTALNVCAGLGLAYLALAMYLRDGWQVQSAHQLYVYAGAVIMPLLIRWLILLWHRVDADGSSEAVTEPRPMRHFRYRAWFDHAGIKFGLFPLLIALPAFRLHQIISFGSGFGEYYSFGAVAYLQGLLIWWGAWSLGLMLLAAFFRVVIESILAALALWRAEFANAARAELEFVASALFYLGVPIWFAMRVLSA